MTTKRIQSGEELSSLLRNLNNNQQKKKQVDGKEESLNPAITEGKVNLDISRSINAELDPSLLAAERREKIDNLKALIKAGKYNPKSEDIAAALQQDIVFEILSNPSDAVNE